MISITDKENNPTHMTHFTVQTRSFQIEKYREPEMYPTLLNFINRQNEKRKQEMEMSEELKRAKREKELKHKRDKSNLDELKQEIANLEKRKIELITEKDLMFQKFKKICKEGDERIVQRAREQQAHSQPSLNITFGNPTSAQQQQPTPIQVPQFLTAHSDRMKLMPQQHQQQHLLTINSLSTQQSAQNNERVADRSPHLVHSTMSNSVPHSTPSLSTSMHHGSHYAQAPQLQFYGSNIGLPPHSVSGSNTNHRLNVRLPTSTPSYSQSPHKPPQSTPYSKSMPVSSHPLSAISTQSFSSQSSPFQMVSERERERQRTLYKRTHEQTNASAVPPPGSLQLPHLPYLPGGFKPMQPPFPQIANQHVINQQFGQLEPNQMFHHLLGRYPHHMSHYIGNPNNK